MQLQQLRSSQYRCIHVLCPGVCSSARDMCSRFVQSVQEDGRNLLDHSRSCHRRPKTCTVRLALACHLQIHLRRHSRTIQSDHRARLAAIVAPLLDLIDRIPKILQEIIDVLDREFCARDMHGGRVGQCVEMPALGAHDIANRVGVDCLAAERDDACGWVAEDVQLRHCRADGLCNGACGANDFAAGLEVTAAKSDLSVVREKIS